MTASAVWPISPEVHEQGVSERATRARAEVDNTDTENGNLRTAFGGAHRTPTVFRCRCFPNTRPKPLCNNSNHRHLYTNRPFSASLYRSTDMG